jgi:NAD-dependent SIR2 family protein deacetylase
MIKRIILCDECGKETERPIVTDVTSYGMSVKQCHFCSNDCLSKTEVKLKNKDITAMIVITFRLYPL